MQSFSQVTRDEKKESEEEKSNTPVVIDANYLQYKKITYADLAAHCKYFNDLQMLENYDHDFSHSKLNLIRGTQFIACPGPSTLAQVNRLARFLVKRHVKNIVALGDRVDWQFDSHANKDFYDYCLTSRQLLTFKKNTTINIINKEKICYSNGSMLYNHASFNINEYSANVFFIKLADGGCIPLDNNGEADLAKKGLWKIILQIWSQKPVLVHCQAGLGRTGHFILMFGILKEYTAMITSLIQPQVAGQFDKTIFNYLTFLRRSRARLVLNGDQFVYAILNANALYLSAINCFSSLLCEAIHAENMLIINNIFLVLKEFNLLTPFQKNIKKSCFEKQYIDAICKVLNLEIFIILFNEKLISHKLYLHLLVTTQKLLTNEVTKGNANKVKKIINFMQALTNSCYEFNIDYLKNNETALQIAIRMQRLDICKLLCDAGAKSLLLPNKLSVDEVEQAETDLRSTRISSGFGGFFNRLHLSKPSQNKILQLKNAESDYKRYELAAEYVANSDKQLAQSLRRLR